MTATATLVSETRTARRAAPAGPAPSLRDLLHRAVQKADKAFEQRLHQGRTAPRLTSRQWTILVALAGNEGASQTALVDVTGVDRSTLADTIRRMLRKGLLVRRRTREDARAYAVKLTDEGRAVLKLNGSLSAEADREVLALLGSRANQQVFLALLGRMARD